MSTLTDIPVQISPAAAAEVERLGVRAEFDRMLEHTKRTLTGLRRIDVTLEPPHDTGTDDTVLIQATRDRSFFAVPDLDGRAWREWKVLTFPPQVCEHLAFLLIYGSEHGG